MQLIKGNEPVIQLMNQAMQLRKIMNPVVQFRKVTGLKGRFWK